MVFICYICQIQMPINRLPLTRLTTKDYMTKILKRRMDFVHLLRTKNSVYSAKINLLEITHLNLKSLGFMSMLMSRYVIAKVDFDTSAERFSYLFYMAHIFLLFLPFIFSDNELVFEMADIFEMHSSL